MATSVPTSISASASSFLTSPYQYTCPYGYGPSTAQIFVRYSQTIKSMQSCQGATGTSRKMKRSAGVEEIHLAAKRAEECLCCFQIIKIASIIPIRLLFGPCWHPRTAQTGIFLRPLHERFPLSSCSAIPFNNCSGDFLITALFFSRDRPWDTRVCQLSRRIVFAIAQTFRFRTLYPRVPWSYSQSCPYFMAFPTDVADHMRNAIDDLEKQMENSWADNSKAVVTAVDFSWWRLRSRLHAILELLLETRHWILHSLQRSSQSSLALKSPEINVKKIELVSFVIMSITFFSLSRRSNSSHSSWIFSRRNSRLNTKKIKIVFLKLISVTKSLSSLNWMTLIFKILQIFWNLRFTIAKNHANFDISIRQLITFFIVRILDISQRIKIQIIS